MATAMATATAMAFVSASPAGLPPRARSGRRHSRLCARRRTPRAAAARGASPAQHALIFDCDGVIVESEELHRVSYNQCWRQNALGFQWSYAFYEQLQNSVGGGKEKMRWYFDNYGWPTDYAQRDGDDAALQTRRTALIKRLHEQKTALYKALVEGGQAAVRPGVLRLIDEAHARGVKLAVCSAANADAIELVLRRLVGQPRLRYFDVVLAGDVVSRKKPHPMIYQLAQQRLRVAADRCVVIEDSHIGLRAALDAGMNVVITHTPYTEKQRFDGAAAVYAGLGEPGRDAPCDVVTVDTLFPMLAAT